MAPIPEAFHDLLAEAPTYATPTTMLPNGLPHDAVVWNDYDPAANRVLVDTERGRRKERNGRADPSAGVLAVEPDSWFRWISVAGEVDEVTEEGARGHIDELARRYTGAEGYGNPIQTSREITKLRPEHVVTFGGCGGEWRAARRTASRGERNGGPRGGRASRPPTG